MCDARCGLRTPVSLLIALLVTLAIGASAAAAAVPPGNLLQDPGDELGDCLNHLSADWTGTLSFTTGCYGQTGMPTTDQSGAISGGAALFYGGSDGTTTATQMVDLTSAATDIDSGTVQAALSGYLGGAGSDNSNMVVLAVFVSATAQPLGTMYLQPVTALDRADATGLLYRDTSTKVPAGTRFIRVTMTATRAGSTGPNNAMADNLSLTLTGGTGTTVQPTLTVNLSGQGHVYSDPAGIDCGDGATACSHQFPAGTSVTLHQSSVGYAIFTGWSGASCAGIGSCTVALNGDTSVSAPFSAIPPPPSGLSSFPPLVWSTPTRAAGYWEQPTTHEVLMSVSCAAPSVCVAVGYDHDSTLFSPPDQGLLISSPDGNGQDWNGGRLDGSNILTGVSCPTVSLCVAVDDAGNVLSSTTPTGPLSSWTVNHIDSHYLTGISCATATSCAATDVDGQVLASTNPAGGVAAWVPIMLEPQHSLTSVSCPSTSLCAVTDDNGRVFTAVSGAFPALQEPWAPTQIDGSQYLRRISCVGQMCAATDDGGNVVVSGNAAGGPGTWTTAHITSRTLVGISCPAQGLCVAIDSGGQALTSTNPLGGSGAWHPGTIGSATGEPTAITCTSQLLHLVGVSDVCVVVDDQGGVIKGRVPLLTIAKHGTGSGTVTSSPAGIDCGAACARLYNSGTPVTLSAAPASGSAFSGWTINGTAYAACGSALTCSLTLKVDAVVSAIFSKSVVSSPSSVTIGSGTTVTSTFACTSSSSCLATVNYTIPGVKLATVARAGSSGVVASGKVRIPAHKRRVLKLRLNRAGRRAAAGHRLKRLAETIAVQTGKHHSIAVRTVRVRYHG